MLTIGSLFSGIGGFELGLEMAGLGPTLWQVEKEPFCRTVLTKHWPEAKRFDDVCTVGANELVRPDLICGGFPCQDVSSAGKRAGLAGSRSGLWREFARIAHELRPSWIVVENVASGANAWADAVVGELEQLGYACLPVPLSASDVGAPHRRSRLFIIAHLADESDDLQPSARCCVSGTPADADREHGFGRQGRSESGRAISPEPRRDGADGRVVSDVAGVAPRSAARSQGDESPADNESLPRVCPLCCAILIERGLAEPGSVCPTCANPLFTDTDGELGDTRLVSGRSEAAFTEPRNGREVAADALRSGRPRTRPEAHEGWRRLAPHVGWSSEPGVVPVVHGLSGGLAGRRRRARIRALGNTIVPRCAEVIGWVVRELAGPELGSEVRP